MIESEIQNTNQNDWQLKWQDKEEIPSKWCPELSIKASTVYYYLVIYLIIMLLVTLYRIVILTQDFDVTLNDLVDSIKDTLQSYQIKLFNSRESKYQ